MNKWNFYTANEIKPLGWMKKQLEIQAKGLSGNLDKMWPDVKDSAWIGGDKEGWERVPYWLDGFIPLAFLLDDGDMKIRAKKYIDAIIANQKPDGWICPCDDKKRNEYDAWALMLISKVLTVWYDCSKDERVPQVLYKALKNYYEMLSNGETKLFEWAKSRWFETFIAIKFTYERYPEEWLISFAELLKEQGADYNEFMAQWQEPKREWHHETHIVNIGMMLKYEALYCQVVNAPYTNRAEVLREYLDKYNGTVFGGFTGDECLSGISPIQGTELCSITEQMYSYEHLFAYSGDNKWAERLEVLAFNALPATISDDMWTHQYDQMVNQIACKKIDKEPHFGTNGDESHLFGLEPNYGCCTANFNQGWPKFMLSAFMHKDNEIINAIAIPGVLNSKKAKIILETNYPFENNFTYKIKAKEDFSFIIRIPSFAKYIKVNGKEFRDGDITFNFTSGQEEIITVSFEVLPRFSKRPNNMKSVISGSLVFSVPIQYKLISNEYVKDDVERKFPYCDYFLIPISEWQYAYSSESLKIFFEEVSDVPFSSKKPPVTVEAQVKRIDWGLHEDHDSVCAKAPRSQEPLSEEFTIKLYPYGCAKLRITELPLI